MIDVNGSQAVQVQIDDKGTVWVNVDGICKFRSQAHHHLEVEDGRVNRKINVMSLDDGIVEDLMEAYDECSVKDKNEIVQKINQLTVREAFDAFLVQNGIIGHTERILGALNSCLSSSTMDCSAATSK